MLGDGGAFMDVVAGMGRQFVHGHGGSANQFHIDAGQFAREGVGLADGAGERDGGVRQHPSSISAGSMLWPPRMIRSLARPVIHR